MVACAHPFFLVKKKKKEYTKIIVPGRKIFWRAYERKHEIVLDKDDFWRFVNIYKKKNRKKKIQKDSLYLKKN